MGVFANPPIIEGDGPSDGDVPTWNATTGTWEAASPGAGGFPTDIGVLDWYVVDHTAGDSALVQVVTAPNPNDGPTGLSAHAPDFATGAWPAYALPAGNEIQVQVGSLRLTEGLWDGIDLNGQLFLVNADGSDAIRCVVEGFFPSAGVAPTAQVLITATESGSDLSNDGTSVVSAAGGIYWITLNAAVLWD